MKRWLLTPILVPLFLAACGVAVEQNALLQTSASNITPETEIAAAAQPAVAAHAACALGAAHAAIDREPRCGEHRGGRHAARPLRRRPAAAARGDRDAPALCGDV